MCPPPPPHLYATLILAGIKLGNWDFAKNIKMLADFNMVVVK